MKQLEGITAEPRQELSARTDSGEIIEMSLHYAPIIQRWFMNLSCKDFKLNGYKILTGDNILRQYRNVLPFGIMVVCENFGPSLIDDFESERVKMYLLSAEEVTQIEQSYRGSL
jgi:hypothetical protein